MSNSLAIAAVTATLRNLLLQVATPRPEDPDNELSDTQVTTVAPDRAGTQEDHTQINLYLYQVMPSAAGRNLDGLGPGRSLGRPPGLALDLFYLISVYGRGFSEVLAQRALGRAMSLLNSYPILSPDDLQAALPGADVHEQGERVRVHPHALGGEEMVRLWGTFQVKHRLSAAYRVSMVLIDHEAVPKLAPQVKTVGAAILTVPTLPVPAEATDSSSDSNSTSGDGGSTGDMTGGGTA
ncbi:MAG: DUF4255 domain-containing protein [Polyangia bacterium]